MAKLYFLANDDDPEYCATKKYWLQYMIENNMPQIQLSEAKRELDTDYFFCKFYLEVGIKKESCGKLCAEYAPRNGKNGRCKFSAHCYEATDKIITVLPPSIPTAEVSDTTTDHQSLHSS